jgi:hypothetical protein
LSKLTSSSSASKGGNHREIYANSNEINDKKMINTSKLSAFSQLTDKSGFSAAYGLTTAEQRNPGFIIDYKVRVDSLDMVIIGFSLTTYIHTFIYASISIYICMHI